MVVVLANVVATLDSYREKARLVYPDHEGNTASDQVYWVPPDPAIGEVLSASSNQTSSGYAKLSSQELGLRRLTVLIGGVGPAMFIAFLLFSFGTFPVAATFPVLYVLITSASLAWLQRQRPTCDYVGVDGVESHVVGATGVVHRRLLFADAATLTLHVRNQVQHYTWRDGQGNICLTLRSPDQPRPDGDFARASEKRWNEVRLERARHQIDSLGHATFSLGRGVSANVTKTSLILFDGAREELPFEQIKSVYCTFGSLELKRNNAPIISKYHVGEIGDLHVLLTLLRESGVEQVGDPLLESVRRMSAHFEELGRLARVDSTPDGALEELPVDERENVLEHTVDE